MYKNLICEMKVSRISNIDIAKKLKIHRNTVKRKLMEENTRFCMEEAQKIQEAFFPTMSTDYLFKTYRGDNHGTSK